MSNINNEFLAQMYAEDGMAEEVEKVAQAAVLGEFVRAQGHAIESLSPEQVVKVAANLFGEDSALVKVAMDHEEPEHQKGGEEEVHEKIAETDFLGRFMAHSFHDELQKLAAQAEQPAESENLAALYKAAANYGHMKGEDKEVEKKKKAFDMLVEARAVQLAQERGMVQG